MNNLTIYLCEVSLILAICFTFYYLLLRPIIHFRWNRLYFLLSYTVSFLIPLLSIDVYPVYLEINPGVVEATASNIVSQGLSESSSLSAQEVLQIAYLTIACLFLFRLMFNVFGIFQLVSKGRAEKQNDHTLILSSAINQSFSFFKYLLHPANIVLTPSILKHELTHIKEGHSMDLIISEIIKSILWLNPFAYAMQKAIKLNHEFICDREAARIEGSFNYAKLLGEYHLKKDTPILVNSFSYKLKTRIIMLQNKTNNSNQKLRDLFIIPVIFGITSLFSFEKYYVPTQGNDIMESDTIPFPKTKIISTYDTLIVFDFETYEEPVTVVRNDVEVVEIIDTVSIYDLDTKEEVIKVVKREVPINEYMKEDGKKFIKTLKSKSDAKTSESLYSKDTITIFDYETYEETVSVIERVNPCYTFFWGDRAFSTSHKIKASTAKFLMKKKIKLDKTFHKECDDVKSFSCRVIFVPVKKDPMVIRISSDASQSSFGDIPEDYLTPETKIFIEDIQVNDSQEYEGIVLTII